MYIYIYTNIYEGAHVHTYFAHCLLPMWGRGVTVCRGAWREGRCRKPAPGPKVTTGPDPADWIQVAHRPKQYNKK